MPPEEVFRVLGSSPDGLSDEEALRRLSGFGKNSLEEAPRLRKTKIFLDQFKSPLILALIFAGILTAILREFVEMGVIFLAVFVNTFLGFWQENKAETVLELLRSYIRTRVRVKRDGGDKEIDAVELVPGDVIRITRGDRIPADARIFYTNRFQADESVLTGESLPEEKDSRSLPAATAVAERTSVVFGGTLAVEGVVDAIVTGTGSMTEFGKISKLIRERERAGSRTPLQAALSRFSLWVGIVLSFLIAVLFLVGVSSEYDPAEMFLISVAVAVSAVPEGLPDSVGGRGK
ncbi:MAG: Cation-transporting ATPase [Candidatus Adlerbacteria bacterium GW2011_GWC1_50_9]|uniref:Cation-transporting ATPase n=1 Tax=Candidatus Adlerbacteria bacterium GW2011_GWC1_50_9 TaxID=1618608 RepID=A0A0G1Z0U2_9BACT|nr:MAG: Cation-transporting ATPase [Candidatus Adlerbacteria bacterium GW2011_GWC1_50_9]